MINSPLKQLRHSNSMYPNSSLISWSTSLSKLLNPKSMRLGPLDCFSQFMLDSRVHGGLFFAIHARQQGPWRADSQNKNSTDFIIAPCYSILHSLGLSQDSSNLTPTFCQNINRDSLLTEGENTRRIKQKCQD